VSPDPNPDPKIERVVVMAERLVEALRADIAALESGRPRQMKMLDPEFQSLSAQYSREARSLNRVAIEAAPAELRARLTLATRRFREALMLHGRVLTRIRNASEGMIKAVAEEVEKRRNRSRPYGAPRGGRPASPGPNSSSLLYNAVV